MKNELLASLGRLSDVDLVRSLKTLIARERDATAEVVAHIAELDTRDVHLREGYRSLYVYCRDALGLSEWESYNRIEVARTARRFPLILDLLADGSVHLTAVKLLAPHLTSRQPSRPARVGPRQDEDPDPGDRRQAGAEARRADVHSPARHADLAHGRSRCRQRPPRRCRSPAAPTPATRLPAPLALTAAARATVAPLSPDRYRLQVTIGGDTLEKLRCAQDMLGHAIPSGDEAAVLDRALTVLLVELAKKKFAQAAESATVTRYEGTGDDFRRGQARGLGA